jgi:predicted DNA-binding transcriptional regulator YafY
VKFYQVLPEDVKKRIDTLQHRLLFWVPAQTWETPHLPALLEGAIEQNVLSISYESEYGRKDRDVQLVGLYSMNGKWYCPAYDYDSRTYRSFRADRILSVSVSTDQSKKQDHSKLPIADWFRKEQEIEEHKEEYDLKVRLTKRGVLLTENDAWLASGLSVMEDGTGYISRTMSSGYMSWAASSFIGCGADTIVEGPPELRKLIRDQLRILQSTYDEESSPYAKEDNEP